MELEHHLKMRERVQSGERVRFETRPVDADYRLFGVPVVAQLGMLDGGQFRADVDGDAGGQLDGVEGVQGSADLAGGFFYLHVGLDHVAVGGKAKPRFTPGSQYSYSSLGMQILGEIVPTVSGQPFRSNPEPTDYILLAREAKTEGTCSGAES
ncbi:serine hydrolase [Nonomuraea rubra]